MCVYFKLVSPVVLSLFMVKATTSGLDVYWGVLHVADPLPNPPYQWLNVPLDWVMLVAQLL